MLLQINAFISDNDFYKSVFPIICSLDDSPYHEDNIFLVYMVHHLLVL